MPRTLSASDEIVIDAPVDVVYARVSDVTAMGKWSPENTGARWVDPDRRAVVGAIFNGRNKRGRLNWTTRCEVTAAQPDVCFAFKVHGIIAGPVLLRFPVRVTWSYSFRALDDKSTIVAETWAVGPAPTLGIVMTQRISADGINGVEMQRRNVHITLQNLKRCIESETNLGV